MTSELVFGPLSQSSTQVARRFAAPERHLGFWIALWVAVIAAEFGTLGPVLFGQHAPVEAVDVVSRLIGGSFAVCGLIAWRRRPDNHSGRVMTAAGFASFLTPLLIQLDAPLAQTAAVLVDDLWVPFFLWLLLTFQTAGRLRTTVDRVLVVGVLVVQHLIVAPLFLLVSEQPGNLLLVVPNAQAAAVVDGVRRLVLLAAFVVTAAVLAARWRVASRPGRRAQLPVAAGTVCLLLLAALMAVGLVGGSPELVKALFFVAVSSLVAVPVAFLAGLLRSRLRAVASPSSSASCA